MIIKYFFLTFINILFSSYIFFTLYYSETIKFIFKDNNLSLLIISYIILFIFSSLILFRLIKIRVVLKDLRCIILILFLCFSSLFLIGSFTGLNITKDISEDENRGLAKFPHRLPFHQKFPPSFDSFINDRAGFRKDAVYLYDKISSYTFDSFNISKNPLRGKGDWLAANSRKDNVKYFQKTFIPSQNELERVAKEINRISDYCNNNGIKLYVMIVPNRNTVYPEFYPDFIGRSDNPEPYLIIADYIKSQTNVNFIDIYNSLLREKMTNQVYYTDDHHWNSLGAYTAYKILAEEVKKDFSDFNFVSKDRIFKCNNGRAVFDGYDNIGDLTHGLYNYKYKRPPLSEICIENPVSFNFLKKEIDFGHEGIWHIKTDNGSGLKIMMFHDSMIFPLRLFLYEGASEIWGAWLNLPSPLILSFFAYTDEIKKFKPDIIIWELTETYINDIMESDNNLLLKRFLK